MKKIFSGIAAGVVILFCHAAMAAACVPWAQVKGDIVKHFFEKNKQFTMITVKKIGAPKKQMVGMGTGKFTTDGKGQKVEIIQPIVVCVQGARVMYSDTAGKKVKKVIALYYRETGGKMAFDGLQVQDHK